MAYCTNCGGHVKDGAKFCGHCGAKMNADSVPILHPNTEAQQPNTETQQPKPNNSQRETVFDGQIHKCPNCGAILAAFVKNCPECGYELRGASSTYSVQEFSRRYSNATSNSQKVDLIRTYVIPNTREDILEFVILAASNIDLNAYSKGRVVVSAGTTQQDITDAWMAKLEQAHQKANLILTDDPYLERINQLYAEKKAAIDSAHASTKRKRIISNIFGNRTLHYVLLIVLLCLVLPLAMCKVGCKIGAQALKDMADQSKTAKVSTATSTPSPSADAQVAATADAQVAPTENAQVAPQQATTELPISGKESRDGFDEKTNKTYSVANYSFSVPDYYVEREKGDNVLKLGTAMENADAIIIFTYVPMDTTEETYLDTVNLYSRNLYQSFGNPQIQSDDSVTIAGMPGRKLLGTGTVDGIPASFLIVHCFDSNNHNLIAYLFVQQDDSIMDYFSDAEKSIESLKLS